MEVIDDEYDVPSPLFVLPDEVGDLLVSFVGTGNGGLQGVLNLREVCSRTKSWVDRLPDRRGKVIFSKAQVRMDSDSKSLQSFLEAPPPSGMTALSLNIEGFFENDPPAEKEELWTRFCAFWSPRLESVELTFGESQPDNVNHPKMLQLLEFPNLRSINTSTLWADFNWKLPAPFPTFLYNVRELSMPVEFDSDDASKREFYSQLARNENLKILVVIVDDFTDLDCLGQFIDKKREKADLELTVTMRDFPYEDSVEMFDEFSPIFTRFVESVGVSRSKIWVHMKNEWNTDCVGAAQRILGDGGVGRFLNCVREIEMWRPCIHSLVMLRRLPVLEDLEAFDVEPELVSALRFPPSLLHLEMQRGFPPVNGLPENLTSLTLNSVNCSLNDLVGSLRLLGVNCRALELLDVTWVCVKASSVVPGGNREVDVFRNLRTFNFSGTILQEDEEEKLRGLLLNVIQVDTLLLHKLSLEFEFASPSGNGSAGNDAALLNEQLLKHFCEGKLASSLLVVEIKKEVVTPGGIPLLEKLQTSVVANRERREQTLGRGRWQQDYPID